MSYITENYVLSYLVLQKIMSQVILFYRKLSLVLSFIFIENYILLYRNFCFTENHVLSYITEISLSCFIENYMSYLILQKLCLVLSYITENYVLLCFIENYALCVLQKIMSCLTLCTLQKVVSCFISFLM